MLRKFLIPTVIVSILLLLTTLITIAKTEVTSVVTSKTPTSDLTKTSTTIAPISTTKAVRFPTRAAPTIRTTTPRQRKITIIHAKSVNPKATRVFYHGRRKINNSTRIYNRRITSGNSSLSDINNNNKQQQQLLNNADADETTTSLLPLQPTLSVTSTTLASLIINQKHEEEQKEQQQKQAQEQEQQETTKVNPLLQPQKEVKQEQEPEQIHQHKPEQQERQNRQPTQDVTDTTTTAITRQQFEEHLINVAQTEHDIQPKNLTEQTPDSFANVELVTAVPVRTHEYIPFELDYNDPTEEKSRPPEAPRHSTINEVLSSLFPKGFSDIFRFSYAPDTVVEEPQPVRNNVPVAAPINPTTSTIRPTYKLIDPIQSTQFPPISTTPKPTQQPINVVKSTPTPFKRPPTSTEKGQDDLKQLLDLSISIPFKPMPTSKPRTNTGNGKNNTATEESIVVEKILADIGAGKSSEEFRDGSNSINKDELLRINRAAKQASVLPSMLLVPSDVKSCNKTDVYKNTKPIVILNANDTDDFVEAPEDDNQIAESQNIAHGVYHTPPAGSSSYHKGVNPDINVHIVHDNNLKKLQDNELQKRNIESKTSEPTRHFQSYQSFVEQAKFLQNSLEEAPSRKFLKNFNPTLSRGSNPVPVAKGNFHYEQTPESHIQTVPPAAQLQYVLLQRSQEHELPPQKQDNDGNNNQQQYRSTQEGYYIGSDVGENSADKGNNENQMHYFIQLPNFGKAEDESRYNPAHAVSSLHTRILDNNQLSDRNAYHTVNQENKGQDKSDSPPTNLVFVTISPSDYAQEQPKESNKGTSIGLSTPYKTPSDFVHEALKAQPENIPDHQPQETENNPKPAHSGGGAGAEGNEKGGFTFVEIQKSINIHNKLITERDGRLVEQHETIYPPPKYGERLHYKPEYHPKAQEPQQERHNYVSLSQNPIHVENLEQHEPAESLQAAQHVLDPSQSLIDIGSIQQSELIQESHIIETPKHGGEHAHQYQQQEHYQTEPEHQHEQHAQNQIHEQIEYHEEEQHHEEQQPDEHHHEEHHHEENHHEEHHHHEEHDLPEPSQNPDQPPIQVPYALPQQNHGYAHYYHHHQYQQPHYQPPLILQEIVEKHVHIPYAVPEPVAYPVPVQHFIDRPVPIETIVEKRIPYPVEKVVEKVVEKHVPVEVEKIVEKPVERIVEKYIDRPVAVPIKIPVALQVTTQNLPFSSQYYPGASAYPNLEPWAQQSTLQRIPTKVLQSYYSKMLKKLVPQMTQAYKSSPLASKPKMVPKFNTKSKANPVAKIGDMRFDLKPPPPPLGSSWDVGARYQYDYNTLPYDLSSSSSVGKQSERPTGGVKTNFDEFQRWRNGHSLKRSPELGMNLHVEYGFKPPLVPSVEIDDKGVPLKAASDLTKGKDE